MTVIDGATDYPTSVNVGILPDAVDVNTVTNKIYVANELRRRSLLCKHSHHDGDRRRHPCHHRRRHRRILSVMR